MSLLSDGSVSFNAGLSNLYPAGQTVGKRRRYLALQEEEHQHADEVSVGAAPPASLGQRLFGLRVVTAEQPERKNDRREEKESE